MKGCSPLISLQALLATYYVLQEFLDRIVEDHGSLDLEWLRDVPPQDTKYANQFNIYQLKSSTFWKVINSKELIQSS